MYKWIGVQKLASFARKGGFTNYWKFYGSFNDVQNSYVVCMQSVEIGYQDNTLVNMAYK